MTYGFDNVAFTAIGTGTTETLLNGGAPLRVPSSAKGIVEILPYQSQLGAYTTDELFMATIRVQSDDVSVEPKRLILPITNTGDGAFTTVLAPALKSYSMNIPLIGFERMNYRATALVGQTVAPGVGITVVYTDGAVGTQQFYQRPDALTTGGTVINTRTASGTITLTGGGIINALYNVVGMTTDLLSEHDVGFTEFESSGFQTPMPYRVAIQPNQAGLGATASVLTGGGKGIMQYNLPQGIPLDSNVTVNTFYTNNDAKGAGSSFICGVRFNR